MKKQFFVIFSALIIISMLTPNITSAQGWNIEMLSSIYENLGVVCGIEVVGDYAYTACRELSNYSVSGLRIFDISDPFNITMQGFTNIEGITYCVAVAEDYAYIGMYDNFHVIDVSDPTEPVHLAQLTVGYTPLDIIVSDGLAYIASTSEGLSIIDVSNPVSPVQIGSLNISCLGNGLELVGNYVYLTMALYGLNVINVSNPSNPVEVGSCITTGYPQDIAIENGYAYVVENTDGLSIVNISNPASPYLISNIQMYWAHDIIADNNKLYLGLSSKCRIMDITDPLNPSEIGECLLSYYAADLDVDGDNVYAAVQVDGIEIIDVSIPENPTIVGNFDTQLTISDVQKYGNYVFALESESQSIKCVEVSDPENPVEICDYSCNEGVSDFIVADSIMYIVSEFNIITLDISIPESPVELGYYSLTYNYKDIDFADGYIFAVLSYFPDDKLRIIDASDPANLSTVVNMDLDIDDRASLAIQDDFVYIASTDNSPDNTVLTIVDISDILNPYVVSSNEYPGGAVNIEVSGAYAYLCIDEMGLSIVNIADPENPYIVGFFDSESPHDMAIFDNFGLLADGESGLRILDMTNPQLPLETGYYDTPGSALGIIYSDEKVYVADEYQLMIFDCSDALGVEKGIQAETPTSFRLLNPYPNPFNAEMTVEFELPRASEVILSLYDVSGRLAGCLEKNNFTSGTHIVHYNAENLASGIYFLQMKSVGFEQTKKITLLK